MSLFIEPIRIALIIFPIMASFLSVPYILYEYRKRGAINWWRTFVIFMFIYYLLNAYFLVILPLPERSSVTNGYREMMQLNPFQFITDIKTHTVFRLGDRSTYLRALTQPVFTQALFNVFLTLPFGVFLRYYFQMGFFQVVFLSFGLSLFFETSQLTGLFFLYPGPYRLFDVDDLILNTVGGVVGYIIAPIISFFFPSREEIDSKTHHAAKRVSLFKRGFVYAIDLTIIKIISSLLSSLSESYLLYMLIYFIYFFVLYTFTKKTVGGAILKVTLESNTEEGKYYLQVLSRTLLMFIFIDFFPKWTPYFENIVAATESVEGIFIYIIIGLVYYIFMFIYFMKILITKEEDLFYDELTNMHLTSDFKK